jgi:hypothetical protein
MRSSEDIQARAYAAVAAINYLLDDKTIVERIDGPIDEAVASFRFLWDPSFSHQEFVRVVGEFVAHVQAHLSKPGPVSGERARDTAVSLLVRYYSNPHEPGYDGALLDAATLFQPYYDGIDVVLMNLAEILRATMREEYVNWVHARYLDRSDRELLSAIVSAIENGHRDLSLQNMLALEPFELADQIPHLLEKLREVQAIAAQLWSDLPEIPEPTAPRNNACASDTPSRNSPFPRSFVLR